MLFALFAPAAERLRFCGARFFFPPEARLRFGAAALCVIRIAGAASSANAAANSPAGRGLRFTPVQRARQMRENSWMKYSASFHIAVQSKRREGDREGGCSRRVCSVWGGRG